MIMFNKLFKKESNKNLNWTDLDRPPKEIFNDACKEIALNLKKQGFSFSKSGRYIKKTSANEDFQYIIEFRTTRTNQRKEIVSMDIYVSVKSKKIKDYRKKYIDAYPEKKLGKPEDLVTQIGLGYLTKENSFLAGSWNLVKTNPELIINIIENNALPSFEKFDNIENLLIEIAQKGKIKEFMFEHHTLDFLMCFGNEKYAYDGLVIMLQNRNWTQPFNELYSDLENGKEMKDNRAFLTMLVERAFLYNLKLKI